MQPLFAYHKTKAGTRISIGAIGGLVLIALLFAATGNLQNLPVWATPFLTGPVAAWGQVWGRIKARAPNKNMRHNAP
jgi:hypothetical protein